MCLNKFSRTCTHKELELEWSYEIRFRIKDENDFNYVPDNKFPHTCTHKNPAHKEKRKKR